MAETESSVAAAPPAGGAISRPVRPRLSEPASVDRASKCLRRPETRALRLSSGRSLSVRTQVGPWIAHWPSLAPLL